MGRTGWRASAVWARADARRRWRSLVVLGLLVAITSGLALAALAGARRTHTAVERLRAGTNAANAVIFPSQVGVFHPDWRRLKSRPEIAELAIWDLLFGSVNDQPGALLFGSEDGRFLGSVDRPVVVKGRMFDPKASDEVVVDERAVKEAPFGSTFTFQPYGADQPDTDTNGAAAHGPKIAMRVVGVVRDISEFLFVSQGQVLVSPGFVARYRSEITTLQNANVRLTHGASDLAALKRDVNDFLAPGAPVLDLHAVSRRVDTTVSVETTALLLLAAAVALAGGLLVGQAVSRSASVIGDDVLVLRAIGMTRSDVGVAATLPHLISAMVGAAVTFAAAVVLSSRFPVGLGRRLDPDVGTHVDWTVLGPGVVLTALLVLAGVMAVGRRTDGESSGHRSATPSALVARIRRQAPVTVGLGVGMAFEQGGGRSSVPVRPALAAGVVGVLGIVAAMTINLGINDSLAHPERAGVTWDAIVMPNPNDYTATNVRPALAATIATAAGRGAASAVVDRNVIDVGGIGVPVFSVRPPSGATGTPIQLTITAGRAPRNGDEAAIGRATAKDLHTGLGGTVKIGEKGDRVRIVGQALFPTDVHAEFDEGLWMTPEKFDAIDVSYKSETPGGTSRTIAVRFAPGVAKEEGTTRLSGALGSRVLGVSPPEVPVELSNLRNVRTLPLVLAGFLALAAIAALSLVLVTSVRRRRRDFAVLRAIGLSQRGTRLVLNWQSTAVGVFGLLIGVPLGLVAGRTGWRLITQRVPLAYVPPLALLAVVVLIPATVTIASTLALWPGQMIGRRHMPAEVLRAE